ncbi:BCCT family transporter [Paracoccus sp. (in: a-proteobacteria)]|uniref:BCCT family transporter n=1 Tax=Paracoccus sp. TaxID=267 RepID=UPI00321F84FA
MAKSGFLSFEKVDRTIFFAGIITVFGVSLPMALMSDAAKAVLGGILAFITMHFSWLYLLTGAGGFFMMLWLAFSRYGDIRLGRAEDEPEFGKFAWIAMLFCAGIGISIVNWAFVEPIYFLNTPPLGHAPGSTESAEWAAMYPMFHWGFVPWALYLLPAIPVAYALYVRQENVVRLSHACRGVLGNAVDGNLGRVIDIVVIFSIMGGVGTSLGLSVPLVSEFVSQMLGVPKSFGLSMGILALWTLIFGWSVWQGLGSGIKILSDINVGLAVLLLLVVLVVGPTVFLLDLWSNSFGLFMDNFFRISFWTDPVAQGSFPRDWTVFYWAWWIAYTPMMGLFVARISRGRTIRELILNGVGWGSLGCWAFFAIWGGYALHLELHGILKVSAIVKESGTPAAVVAILRTLPASWLILPVFTALCFVFLATTLDSSAYMVASVCSRNLSGYEEPARWLRMVWAFAIAFVGVGLLSVGGLEAVQLSTVIVALPMIPVLVIVTLSFLRWAKRDFGPKIAGRQLVLPIPPGHQSRFDQHGPATAQAARGDEDALPSAAVPAE